MTAVCLHARHRRLCLVRKLAVDPVDQQFGEAQNRIERRPELVAHIREELGLVAAGCLQLPAFLLDLAEQLRVLNGEHRLGRKGFHQVNDLLVEFTRLATPDDKRADDLVRPEQRNDQDAAIAGVEHDLLNGRRRSCR